MKYADLLNYKDAGDLEALMEALAVYIARIPKVERPGGEIGRLIDNVYSYRRKIKDLSDEERSILWQSVEHLLEEVAGIDPEEVLEDVHTITNPDALEPGLYWLFPGSGGFVPCDDHRRFIHRHQSMFVERLGLDGWELMRAKHSAAVDPIALALAAGAVRCRIEVGDGHKKSFYQLCQRSLPWLKSKISSMPIMNNSVRVWDPARPYGGWRTGILFILKK